MSKKLFVEISDNLWEDLEKKVIKKFGLKKGGIKKIVEEALRKGLKEV